MQAHIRNDLLYLLRLMEACSKIMLYAKQFTSAEDFFQANDQKEFNASLNLLSQIGEQSSRLSNTLTAKYSAVNWSAMKGMRNRIVHDYTGVDLFITFETIKSFVPDLPGELAVIILSEIREGNFDKEELKAARHSPYLKHVDFSLLEE
jgi:uncharacterized protein with HEPN domain